MPYDAQVEISKSIVDSQTLAEELSWQVEYWRPRNRFIEDVRKHINGQNEIQVPKATQYVAKSLHTFLLAGMQNEKTARYLHLPVVQIVVDDPLDSEAREKSTRIERSLNRANYEMERLGDGDTWGRVVADCTVLDGGAERIECNVQSHWRELAAADSDALLKKKGNEYAPGSILREEYKKSKGVPFRSLYVPLEYVFPVYDGNELVKVFELEERTLYSCLRNPNFNKAALSEFPTGRAGGIDVRVPIVHYCDSKYHCYFALYPSGDTNRYDVSSRFDPKLITGNSQLQYLYGYEHNLGRPIYNFIAGRYGGWKTSNNQIEGVGRGLLELSQGADELFSQVATNIRVRYWPNLNYQVNPELRGFGPGGVANPPPRVQPGEEIITYIGEKIEPVFKAENDSAAPWMMDKIEAQIGKLGGSGVLHGQQQPGVDTGYQYAQQISQAEHLDEKLEQNLATGAIQHFTILMLHVRELGEKIPVYYTEREELSERKVGSYYYLDPDDLIPLPQLDIKVRKPKPIDIMSSIRAAREASDDRGGKGPLLSDDTIREQLMAVDAPDLEEKKIRIQQEKQKLLDTNVISNKIGEAINIKLARQGIPEVSPEMLGKIDPALLGALQQQVSGGQVPPGGIDPRLLSQLATTQNMQAPQGGGLPHSGGMAPGDSQLQNRVGEAIAGAQMVR